MRARGQLTFLILNILVTFGVAFAVVTFLNQNPQNDSSVTRFATVQVIITATTDPDATPLVRIITQTPPPNEVSSLPTGVLDATPAAGTPTLAAQGEARTAGDVGDTSAEGSGLPQGCISHTLEEGESPSLLALQYEVSQERILEVNGLTEDDARFLQIGQQLIIPLPDCPLTGPLVTPEAVDADGTPIDAQVVVEGSGTPEPSETPTPTLTPTITLAPTAANASVAIVDITAPGDVTREAVTLTNNGSGTVNITGWTLRDLDGSVYTFAEQRLFGSGLIEVFTQIGTDTTIRKYWGQTSPVFGPGDVAILSDANGQVQSVFRIPAPVDLE
jgi:hypothetical protein